MDNDIISAFKTWHNAATVLEAAELEFNTLQARKEQLIQEIEAQRATVLQHKAGVAAARTSLKSALQGA